MPIRSIAAVAAALLVVHVRPALAQRTGDQARLIFTVSGAYLDRKGLWSVSPQPVPDVGGGAGVDNFALSRGIMRTFGAGFSGTYFAGEHVGISADAFLIGLGYEDSCSIVGNVQSAQNGQICEFIDQRERRAAAVTVSAGGLFRINSRDPISPFARVNAGLLFSNQSALRTEGFTDQGLLLTIYDDDSDTRVSPAIGLGVGVTVALARAYHLRFEVRDNIVGVQEVTGTTPGPRTIPPHEEKFQHLLSLLVGVDVILERQRGRRY
jgi:hypothetical protein